MPLLRWLRRVFDRFGPGMSLVLPWMGAMALALAAGFALHSWNAVRFESKAVATVTENVSGFAPGGGVVYYPRLRFMDRNGKLDQLLLHQGSEEIEFAAGDDLPVRYPAGHPEEAYVATVWRLYRAAILLAIFGVVLVDLGLLCQFQLKRQKAPALIG